jgi:dTDP-4-dehydrorhamnose 3,5-epimerase
VSGGRASAVAADRPNRGIYLGPAVWRTTRRFSPDCVILVLASAPYDEADYLRAYAAFRAYLAQRRRWR